MSDDTRDWIVFAGWDLFLTGLGALIAGPKGAIAAMVGGGLLVALALLWRRSKRVSEITWEDIEARFKELHHAGRIPAGQVMTRDPVGGLTWWIVGLDELKPLAEQVRQLCALAGRRVKVDALGHTPRVKGESDDVNRWMWFLVELKQIQSDGSKNQSDYPSEPANYLRVDDIVRVSIAGCVDCIRLTMSTP